MDARVKPGHDGFRIDLRLQELGREMPKPIMNLDEAVFDDVEENGIYTSKRATIGAHIGARKLGYNLTVLPPGKV